MANILDMKPQEEDASVLKFPKEFEHAETLLISEVHMLMDNRFRFYSVFIR